jgi:putative hemolysin
MRVKLHLGQWAVRISTQSERENNLIETFPKLRPRHTEGSQRSTVKTVTSDPLLAETSLFRVSLAHRPDHLTACQRLRYSVFNLELSEGLSTSDRDGLDIDPFDNFCDHLMVSDLESGKLVGTYRLQTGEVARRNLGYYGNQFFDFSVYEPVRKEVLELGRACVHVDFRNIMVLHALWKGIAVYATRHDSRYLLGCSSISSQDENYGMAMYDALKEKYLVEPALRTVPQPGQACQSTGVPVKTDRPPRLFRAYLEISGRICGPPAIDREFKTIDFLTLVDLANLPDRVRTRFF